MMIHPLNTSISPPAVMNNPFDYEPHPLCLLAAEQVMNHIEANDACRADALRGKMFGVLVVEADGVVGFLAAYSGLLAGRNDWPWFVPPVFDAQQPDGHFKQTERQISAINRMIEERGEMKEEGGGLLSLRKRMSEDLQQWLFEHYVMVNVRGERKNLIEIWHDYHTSPRLRRRFPLPPAGSGDCCAPKLLQQAFLHGMRPLCMAEFWYGASPKAEVRHHGHFYPACRGKCLPILTFMLGKTLLSASNEASYGNNELEVVYDDEWIAVVNKPAGMLSVPGKEQQHSVFTVMRQRFPDA